MRMDRIYTKTGDAGQTSLVSGERVAKQDPRVDAFGTIDELNSVIGLIRTWGRESSQASVREESACVMRQIQNDLFDLGAIVACSPVRVSAILPPFPETRTLFLERRIDHCQATLGALTSFVLPGGSMLNAYAHLARTVCRRAERELWRLHAESPVPDGILTYVNRLSDYLFVYSRWVMRAAGQQEFLWEPGGGAAAGESGEVVSPPPLV